MTTAGFTSRKLKWLDRVACDGTLPGGLKMPPATMHRLADVSARSEPSGIAIRIAGKPPMILPYDLARRLAAVLAVALVDARSARRTRLKEPGNG